MAQQPAGRSPGRGRRRRRGRARRAPSPSPHGRAPRRGPGRRPYARSKAASNSRSAGVEARLRRALRRAPARRAARPGAPASTPLRTTASGSTYAARRASRGAMIGATSRGGERVLARVDDGTVAAGRAHDLDAGGRRRAPHLGGQLAEVRRAATAAGVKVVSYGRPRQCRHLRGPGPARRRGGGREHRARDARRARWCSPTRWCATVSRPSCTGRPPAGRCSLRARRSRARPRRCASSRPPSSARTDAAPGPTRRSAMRRWRRCSPRSTAPPPTTAPGERRRVLREYFSAGAADTVAGPLAVLALRRRRAAAVHRVPFAEGGIAARNPSHELGHLPTQLNPTITRTMLTVFVVGDVLGAGIYALVGTEGEVGGAIWAAFSGRGACWRSSRPPPTPSSSRSTRRRPGAALYVHRAFKTDFFSPSSSPSRSCPSGVTSAATLATRLRRRHL